LFSPAIEARSVSAKKKCLKAISLTPSISADSLLIFCLILLTQKLSLISSESNSSGYEFLEEEEKEIDKSEADGHTEKLL